MAADDDPELAAALAMSMGDGDGDSDAALASKLVAACGLLEAQPAEARATATKTLKKLVENLVAAPDNPKFRRVRVSNAKIQQAVLGVPGGEEFLRALGFKDSEASAEGVRRPRRKRRRLRTRCANLSTARSPTRRASALRTSLRAWSSTSSATRT